MTTLNHTESMPRFLHLRAYLAGAGATGALIAGAAIVLLSLATFLAFSGLPFGASAGDSGNAYLRHGSGAPATTAASLAGAPGAVAARPAAGGGGSSSAPGPSGASAGASGGGATQSTGPTSTTGSTPSPGCTIGCSEAPSQPGPVTNAVQGADDTLGTDLSGSTEGLTGRVDDTVRGTLNDAGGAVGSPGLGDQVTHLGDQVTQTGNRLAGGLLPPGG